VQGDHDGAAAAFREFLRLTPNDEKSLAITVDSVVDYADTLGRIYPIALTEPLLAKCLAALGPDHSVTIRSMFFLAHANWDTGRPQEAVTLFKRSLANQRALSESVGSLPSRYTYRLVSAYEHVGQPDQAERLLAETLDRFRKTGEPTSPATAGLLAQLGSMRLKLQEWEQAEPILRECLAIRERNAPDDWTTFNAKSMLGGALLGQHQYAQAEPLLLKGYEGMRQREAMIPPPAKARLTEALERLARLYDATEQKDKAAERRKELDAAREPVKKPQP
jgi:tetratricopeptide (TPR) repeat protein